MIWFLLFSFGIWRILGQPFTHDCVNIHSQLQYALLYRRARSSVISSVLAFVSLKILDLGGRLAKWHRI